MHLHRLAAAALVACATAAHAADSGVASYTIDPSATLMTDVRTRGISDSLNKPGLRLSVLAAHESGLVALAELATVSRKQFLDGDGLGVTLAGGYRFGDPERWHFGVGLATEFFPGAKFDAPHGFDFGTFMTTDIKTSKYDSSFAVLEVGYGAIEGRILNVISKSYRGADTGGVCGTMLSLMADPTQGLECYARGDHGSRGSWLFDIDFKHPITPSTTLNLHAGYQKVANFSEANFSDWRIGITHKHWGFEWNVDALGTNTRVRELYLAQDGANLRATDNAKLVLSVTKHF
jgi:hypothetical protein